MSLKLCYNHEIHRINKIPSDFTSLLNHIQEIFTSDLPPKFRLEYQDVEGDKVIIHNDEDYKIALEAEPSNNSNALKIFITDVSEADNVSFIVRESIISAKNADQGQTELARLSTKFSEAISEIKEIAQLNSEAENLFSAGIPMKEVSFAENRDIYEAEPLIEYMCKVKEDEIPPQIDDDANCFESQKGKPKTRKAIKAKKIEEVAKKTLYKEIPAIASMVKELLLLEDLQIKSEAPKKSKKVKVNKAVHSHIACNMCKTSPIVGTRYKSLVLDDYDLCVKCEKTAFHPYPLIKIRDESQNAYVDGFFNSNNNNNSNTNTNKLVCLVEQSKKKKKNRNSKKNTHREEKLEKIVEKLVGELEELPDANVEVSAMKLEENLHSVVDSSSKIDSEPQAEANEEPLFQIQPQVPEVDIRSPLNVNSLVNEVIQQQTEKAYEKLHGLSNFASNLFGGFSNLFQPRIRPNRANKDQIKMKEPVMDEKVEEVLADEKLAMSKAEEEEDKVQKMEYDQYVTERTNALLEVFPENNFDELYEYISRNPEKSIEELAFDLISHF